MMTPPHFRMLGDSTFAIELTVNTCETVAACRISIVCEQNALITWTENCVSGIVSWLRAAVALLNCPLDCRLGEEAALSHFAEVYAQANLAGDYQYFVEVAREMLRADPNELNARRTSLPERYGIADLLDGGTFDPKGFCYVLCWKPVAHIAVLGQNGQFWSMSVPPEVLAARLVDMESQLVLWAETV